MCKESLTALSLFEGAVLEQADSLIRFTKANNYEVAEVRIKIFSGDTLVLTGGRASLPQRIRKQLTGPPAIAKLAGLLSSTASALLLGADQATILLVMLTSSLSLLVCAVVEAAYGTGQHISRRLE